MRAALRRAWTTDPAIRDFIGIAENQWDFTAPEGVPGFGALPDGEQVRRLLARVMGEREPSSHVDSGARAPSRVAETEAALPPDPPPKEESQVPAVEREIVQRNNAERGALGGQQASEPPQPRPRHGSALPR
jgi:hypothetical protein